MTKVSKLIEQFLRDPPEAKYDDVRYILEIFDFLKVRAKGSHYTFRNAQGLTITVPKKGGKVVKGVYIRQIVVLLKLKEWSDENNN